MAFTKSSGYGNLPQGNFSPQVFSKKALMTLKKKSIVDAITNTEFEGEINTYGDTVHIIKQPNVTVADYTRGAQLTTQDLDDAELTMVIDQAKYYQFGMDDIEKAHEHVSFEDLARDSAAYALRDSYDQNVLTAISSGVASANNLGSVTVGFGAGNDYTPLDLISRASRVLDDNNVPEEGRWAALSPAFFEALRREDSKLIEANVTGDAKSIVRQPNMIDVHGFKLYKSNNLPTSGSVMLFGHKEAVATASSILKSEVIRSQNTFGDLYRGLFVFGRKVLRDVALVKATVTIGDV
jgi:hypothetical protein